MITEDPLYQLSINYYRVFVERISRQRGAWQVKMLPLYKIFQEGMLEMKRDQVLYPDANGSLRVSYGTVPSVIWRATSSTVLLGTIRKSQR